MAEFNTVLSYRFFQLTQSNLHKNNFVTKSIFCSANLDDSDEKVPEKTFFSYVIIYANKMKLNLCLVQ